jgi:diguanylate cyclase (GGDEF)-like protein
MTEPGLEKQLATELESLRHHLVSLEEERNDLEIALTTAIEHGDIIEHELESINARLRDEIGNRQLAESRLKMLVDALIAKQKDLEILVETLIEHGDSVDAQWWKQLCDAEQMAEQDPLTGLINRRGLDNYLDRQWLLHSNLQQPLAVLVCDIDYFKAYNDRFGHSAGDVCLQKIASVLKNNVTRDSDLVTRFGGEEFVIILANTSLKGAISCAARIQKMLATEKIPHCQPDENAYVTLSIGVISKIPDLAKSFNTLFEEADRLLYLAKIQGRNRICHDESV